MRRRLRGRITAAEMREQTVHVDARQAMTSTGFPIAWQPALTRNGQDDYRSGVIFVMDRIGKCLRT